MLHYVNVPTRVNKSPATKSLQGGKGYGLVTLADLGMPVPPAVIIPTTECTNYYSLTYHKDELVLLSELVIQGLKPYAETLGYSPLLSVRSGAPVSLPGMMDTILNVGLNYDTIKSLEKRLGKRCAWDSFRRLYCMIATVVHDLDISIIDNLIADITTRKLKLCTPPDNITEWSADHHKMMVQSLDEVFKYYGYTPISSMSLQEQLELTIKAVFQSWTSPRAIEYRKRYQLSSAMGTAVVIQAMVFGNLNEESGSGVLFTRNITTGDNRIHGEYLLEAQGEDVVSGSTTPLPLSNLRYDLPECYDELLSLSRKLENYYGDVQDIEFTIQDGVVYLLQTRTAKRTLKAALRIARDFIAEGVPEQKALSTIPLDQLGMDGAKIVKKTHKYADKPHLRGLPASTGAINGKVAYTLEDVLKITAKGNTAILVRNDTTPDDIEAIIKSGGVVTRTGGATCHAAVVARALGKVCVVGCSNLAMVNGVWYVGDTPVKRNSNITMDGSRGFVWVGTLVDLDVDDTTDDLRSLVPISYEKVQRIEDIKENSVVTLGQLKTVKELRVFLDSLPSDKPYLLEVLGSNYHTSESDRKLENVFGAHPPRNDIGTMVIELLTRGTLASTVQLIAEPSVCSQMQAIGFKTISTIKSLEEVLSLPNGSEVIVQSELITAIGLSSYKKVLQLLLDAGRELTLHTEPKNLKRQLYELIMGTSYEV